VLAAKDAPRCATWQAECAGLIIKAEIASGDQSFGNFADFRRLKVGVTMDQTRHGQLPNAAVAPE